MKLENYLPNSAVRYIEAFRTLAALTNAALDYAEKKTDWISEEDRDKTLARLAESVEAIASLRGDDAAYYDARPDGLIEYQKEMYAIEDQLRGRLTGLGYKYPAQ
jgi:hypothetical protein